jgi:predicted neuraminidase
MKWLRRISFGVLALGALWLGLLRYMDIDWQPPYEDGFSINSQATPVATSQPITLREVARHDIPMPANTPAAHASFLLADKDGGLRAFWFAGSRESGEDVQILMSEFARKADGTDVWSVPAVVVNRHAAFKALGVWNPSNAIRRLGNPVAWIDAQGRTHLYVVATGLGGWAASRILHLRQDVDSRLRGNDKRGGDDKMGRDDKMGGDDTRGGNSTASFKPIGFLQLSPFFNLSVLVRGTPIPMADGGALLPAYFEMGIKYPLAIRLDANGGLVQSRDSVVRMAGNLASLQPTLAVASQQSATAYLRDNSGDKLLRFVQTTDGGKSWIDVPSSQGSVGEKNEDGGADFVINPDSSIAAVRVGGQTLLIHNPQTSGRHRLVIEGSKGGLRGFKRLATLEYEPEKLDGVEFNEYSYPSAVVVSSKEGDKLHVSYTYQKRFIRHVVLAIEMAAKESKP